jgi:hypothetical protein
LYFDAITRAPEIRIRFLIMYCPAKVGQYGKASKQMVFRMKTGKNVAAICINNNGIVYGMHLKISLNV